MASTTILTVASFLFYRHRLRYKSRTSSNDQDDQDAKNPWIPFGHSSGPSLWMYGPPLDLSDSGHSNAPQDQSATKSIYGSANALTLGYHTHPAKNMNIRTAHSINNSHNLYI
ncbi:unnamed protein product [Rhizoctonia solani]|uniref:Uncharacterized protein n=1 Tax=Rhizoctonia solani TaxID=456999 RepID=A0A8H3HLR1_9AGAM|nr:unnamed protein product [Rhizoctonia solani]